MALVDKQPYIIEHEPTKQEKLKKGKRMKKGALIKMRFMKEKEAE